MELRQKTNDELFTLYEGELTSHHRSGRGKKQLAFKPMMQLAEGSYFLGYKYKVINSVQINQTILPFKVKKASRVGEVYVETGQLQIYTI